MLTPSSNTVLEPMTASMLAETPDVQAHFSRFRVVQISLGEASQAQFDHSAIVAAAGLLADAKVDSICWNGTSAGWLGFHTDEALCQSIRQATGVPACSAVLGFNAALAESGVRRIAIVSPYTDEVQDRIIANYAAAGVECVADRRLRIEDNFAFGTVTEADIQAMCLEVAAAGPEAILIYCTNMAGGRIAPLVEQATGIRVLDSVAVALWASLRAADKPFAPVNGWGRLLAGG
jgi:maleate isomerase